MSARQAKRVLPLMVAAVAVLFLAAACGGADDTPAVTPGPGTPTTTTPADGDPAPTEPPAGALRDAWSLVFSELDEVRAEHGSASTEFSLAFGESIVALIALLPPEMPLPERQRDDAGGLGSARERCHGANLLNLGIPDPNADEFSMNPSLAFDDAVAWFEAAALAAGWDVSSSELENPANVSDFQGVDFHLRGHGDEWRVAVREDFVTNISYCPAPR